MAVTNINLVYWLILNWFLIAKFDLNAVEAITAGTGGFLVTQAALELFARTKIFKDSGLKL